MSSPTKSPHKKRPRPKDFDKIAEITRECSGSRANVHGVVSQLSPVKTGPQRKYFSGKLSDGNSAIRFISFAPRTLDVVPAYEAISAFKGKSVVVENCEVKTNSYGGAPELILGNFTSFDESSKDFGDISFEDEEESSSSSDPAKIVTVSQLSSVEEYSPISIKIRVLRVDPCRTTSSGSLVQTVAVADATGTTTVDLWAQFIDQLKPNICYMLKDFRVKSFQEQFCLFSPRKRATIVAVPDDIGNITEDGHSELECNADSTIGTVSEFLAVRRCPQCKKGSVSVLADQPTVGQCNSCKSLSRMELCSSVTTATFTVQSSGSMVELSGHGDVLAAIAQCPLSDVTKVKLVLAEKFDAYSKNSIIRRIERKGSTSSEKVE